MIYKMKMHIDDWEILPKKKRKGCQAMNEKKAKHTQAHTDQRTEGHFLNIFLHCKYFWDFFHFFISLFLPTIFFFHLHKYFKSQPQIFFCWTCLSSSQFLCRKENALVLCLFHRKGKRKVRENQEKRRSGKVMTHSVTLWTLKLSIRFTYILWHLKLWLWDRRC